MRMVFVLTLVVGMATGCAHNPQWSELKAGESKQYFVLEKDHVQTTKHGLLAQTWVAALHAGKYTLSAEDENGYYYLGVDGGCVIRLTSTDADEYLETGMLRRLRYNVGGLAGIFPGGLWLPKNDPSLEPRLFYIHGGDVNQTSTAALGAVQPQTVAQGVGAGLGGAIVGMMMLRSGELVYVPYASEMSFVANLQIIKE